MATMKSQEADITMEDDYNESEDSDFLEDAGQHNISDSDSDEGGRNDSGRPTKRRKVDKDSAGQDDNELGELDSGDEATIRERKRAKRKAKKTGADDAVSDGEENEGWRAKTRAMREKEHDERKRKKLATVQGSTIDVAKVWEEMNRPGNQYGKVSQPNAAAEKVETGETESPAQQRREADGVNGSSEEMITIKRTYRFAGELHTEEKVVPKSSAEARLWLTQQAGRDSKKADTEDKTALDAGPIRRPLRFISRFDPNYHNLEAFKRTFASSIAGVDVQKGPKLNVVEKSKMDWAAHVDQEGLKDELDVAARAKEGYLNRMDFLNDVEVRREEEARRARLKV